MVYFASTTIDPSPASELVGRWANDGNFTAGRNTLLLLHDG